MSQLDAEAKLLRLLQARPEAERSARDAEMLAILQREAADPSLRAGSPQSPPAPSTPARTPPTERRRRRAARDHLPSAGGEGASGGFARAPDPVVDLVSSSDEEDDELSDPYATESEDEEPDSGAGRAIAVHDGTDQAAIDHVLGLLHCIPKLRSEAWIAALPNYVTKIVTMIRAGQREAKPARRDRAIFAGGSTQSNKTLWKVVAVVVCYHLGILTILASTVVENTKELTLKISEFLDNIPEAQRPPIITVHGDSVGGEAVEVQKRSKRDSKKLQVQDVCMRNGCLVTNDTARALEKARVQYLLRYAELKLDRHARHKDKGFVLIMDEADAFQRTEHETLKLEKAVADLRGLRPYLTLSVSATLLPVMVKHARLADPATEEVPAVYFTKTLPNEYNSCNDLEPLRNSDGAAVFLDPKELVPGNAYISEKVEAFVADALGREKSLTLLISTPRVEAEGGLSSQAKKILALAQSGGLAPILIVVSGKCTKIFPPTGQAYIASKLCTDGKKNTPSKIMSDADDKYGLRTPMVIMGYSQMMRGSSFRSEKRVPTHIVPALGPSMSIEKIVQSAGRATFMGKQTLRDNGFDCARALMYPADFESMCAYGKLMQEVNELILDGRKLSEVFTGNTLLSSDANILACQLRPVGNRNERIEVLMQFEAADPASLARREGHKYIQQKKEELSDLQKELLKIASRPDFVERIAEIPGDTGGGVTSQQFLMQLLPPLGRYDPDLISRKHVTFNLDQLFKQGFIRKETSVWNDNGKRVKRSGGAVYYRTPDIL